MAEKSLRFTLMRIDVDLAKQIRDYAKKNNLGFREASREIANKLNQFKIKSRKKKEIKI